MSQSVNQNLVALRMAIQTEIDGYEFYTRAAAQAQHPRTQALFQNVAQDEIGHREWLEAQAASLRRDGHWLPQQLPQTKEIPDAAAGLPIFAKEHIVDISAHTSELTALRTAVLIEQDAVNFYRRAAGQIDDPAGKEMFEFLADFEAGHRRVLEEEYNFLLAAFRDEMGFAPF
ncbi:MAG: ferritin-like domain-containing protein [Chloroflexota bacterium]